MGNCADGMLKTGVPCGGPSVGARSADANVEGALRAGHFIDVLRWLTPPQALHFLLYSASAVVPRIQTQTDFFSSRATAGIAREDAE
uniref:Uncharacterized protein n=1 Tax=Hyaloperonospora arabidopsidis (strain Emoy2) TaxID=559515 RepID=M4BRG5_HYAAE